MGDPKLRMVVGAAVGNRLSEDGLAFIERVRRADDADWDELARVAYYAGFAVTEIRERRASDLTDEDREALRWLRDRIGVRAQFPMFNLQSDESRRALAALDRLLGKETP